MTPEFAYFLKVNIAFALFYAFYRLFFYKDTFFKLRRMVLLSFFALAVLYPLLNFQEWVSGQEPIAEAIYLYSAMLPEVSVTAVAYSNVLQTLAHWGCLFYGLVVALLCVRFLMQLGSILVLALRSRVATIQGVRVHLLDHSSGPFSFFKLIFLHPADHSEQEIDEILTHECTHVSQWHSVDVIVSELICTLCWINPFAWLLKREVRYNLEYLADNTVIQSGYDCKSYQYHLLGLAHHQAAATIYNSFNVLHLKNRISMMNKKRSRGISRTKYLMFIPLTAALMLLSNIEAVARITGRLAKDVTLGIEPAPADTVPVKKEVQKVGTVPEDRVVFTVVEVMPKFPGGDDALISFLLSTVKYPAEARKKGIHGRVICGFVVNKDGSISDIKVLRGIDPLLDAEAMRVVGQMPTWQPGTQRGKAVAVKYTIPIAFSTGEEEKPSGSDVASQKDRNDVFRVVEVMPRFPGGDNALIEFLSKNIHYPKEEQAAGVKGRVIVKFIVEKDGSITNTEILRGVSPAIDAEAIRLIGTMPQWQPGTQRGNAVRVLYTVPITFSLQ